MPVVKLTVAYDGSGYAGWQVQPDRPTVQSVMEDAVYISPEWRDRFLAASLFWLKGSEGPDSPVVKRTRAALA